MLIINDTLGGEPVKFYCAETNAEAWRLVDRLNRFSWWGMDTESTGLNPYKPGWQLRTFQFGRSNRAYVIPARFKKAIECCILSDVNWIGHNGPHDMRCIDVYLGYETGVVCRGETFIPSHHDDPRNVMEGGIGHGLKELAIARVARDAGKWETALKVAFKEIQIPMPGEYFKSGPRKGQPKTRKANISEGWGLIDPASPAYIAYAAADPILTYLVWKRYRQVVRNFRKLYSFDHKVQSACDALQRRGLRLDIDYTQRLDKRFVRVAEQYAARAKAYGCGNVNSGAQIAETLTGMGVQLRERTPTGNFKTDNRVLREVAKQHEGSDVADFIRCVLAVKQLLKRKESYTSAFLRELDADGRVHASINSLAARTARMSVSNPPLQQLPTKDRGEDID